jgi:hypothetical protein
MIGPHNLTKRNRGETQVQPRHPTTLRMILGRDDPTAAAVSVLGRPRPGHRQPSCA